ncbi:uncharacterized protein LOC124683394 [Lolium rigidum]|uniref:uncharacterized protein LOC124683394 n=1 Tax=Lolium rigidum TaxID=89674 RepID=UPI001F5E011D|nr:uncharacterized protein LOC124683394 [Lolium rigidum]
MASLPITWWRVFFPRLQITGLHLPALCLQLAMSGSNVPDTDIFRGSQSSRLIARSMRKEELKLDFQTSERVEATAPETKTNMHGYNVVRERSTDVNKLKPKMGVAAAKKSTKRKSLTTRTESSNPVSNRDSEEPTGD